MRERRKYSIDNQYGSVAVLCPEYGMGDNEAEITDDYERLAFEAETIATMYELAGRAVYLSIAAHLEEFVRALDDVTISSTIVIGHGNLSGIYMDEDTQLDWHTFASYVSHLKTGHFIQCFCGHKTRRFSVPLGLFAISDQTKLIAPLGTSFEPELKISGAAIAHEEAKMKSVSHISRVPYETARFLYLDPNYRSPPS